MLDLDVKINNDEIINAKLSIIAKSIDDAVELGNIIMLDKMDKKWHMLRRDYSKEILNSQQLIDTTLAVARKLDNAKRELVKLRKQHKKDEYGNQL